MIPKYLLTEKAEILTYQLEELMGTKLKALFQRKKGRDLFDFWYVMNNCHLDIPVTLEVFQHYSKLFVQNSTFYSIFSKLYKIYFNL